jgi:hypothetical protein
VSDGPPAGAAERPLVLAVGLYAPGRERKAAAAAAELARSAAWSVEQRWIALERTEAPPELAAVTISEATPHRPRFALLNGLLRGADVASRAFVLVLRDDVSLPAGFLDRYLAHVVRHDLALAQPASSHGSTLDDPFVEQLDGVDARLTRFVATGPLFSMRRDALPLLLPFDETSPMGWGYEFVWPVAMEAAGLKMGIVDATPVEHHLSRPAGQPSLSAEQRVMKAFLAARPHISRAEAFSLLEAYAR